MNIYAMTRRCITGANEYRFYRGFTPSGTGDALVLPGYPLTLRGGDLELHYSRDLGITLFPGISLPISEGDSRKAWGRVIWEGHGRHRLNTPFGTVYVAVREEEYRILREGAVLGHMRPAQPGVFPLQTDDWEARMILAAPEPLPEALAMVLLALPLLQLGP